MENLPSHVTRIQLPISEAANFEALRKRTESVSLQAINHKLLKKVDPYQEYGVSDQKSANLCMAQARFKINVSRNFIVAERSGKVTTEKKRSGTEILKKI